MLDDVVRVDIGGVRGAADELVATAYRLGQGLSGTPGLTVDSPGWTAAQALAGLESAVHTYLTATGGHAAQMAEGLLAAADAYEAADDRAAHRLARAG